MSCCKNPNADDKTSFYYIEFLGIKEHEIDTDKMFGGKHNEGEDWKSESKPEDFGIEMPKKIKIPEGDLFTTTIVSDNGLFIPSMVVDHLKATYGCDKISIQLIREMTHEEYEAEIEYQTTKKSTLKSIEAAIKNKISEIENKKDEVKLPNNILSEIESLTSQAENGRLRVIAPDKDEPEYHVPTDDDLLEGGGFRFDDED